jgi:hypothetical protein
MYLEAQWSKVHPTDRASGGAGKLKLQPFAGGAVCGTLRGSGAFFFSFHLIKGKTDLTIVC